MDKLIVDSNDSIDISFVVPIFNEVDSIPVLMDTISELESVIKKSQKIKNCEFILIDDASTDNSSGCILSNISYKISHDKIILNRHSANFGYGAAIQSGIHLSKYDWIITFDADGQHKPAEIVKVINGFLIQALLFTNWEKV